MHVIVLLTSICLCACTAVEQNCEEQQQAASRVDRYMCLAKNTNKHKIDYFWAGWRYATES